MGYLIRRMEERDAPQVTEIDREAFSADTPLPPYASYKREVHNSSAYYIVASTANKTLGQKASEEITQNLSWFKRFLAHNRSSEEGKYASAKEYIVGFAGFWVMLKEAHITALAVRNAYRQRGIGEKLLISVIELATQLNVNTITLEVRASNEIAQALYRKYGFKIAGVRHGYYSSNGEDAVLMDTDIIASAPFQAHFQQLKQAHSQKWGGIFATIQLV